MGIKIKRGDIKIMGTRGMYGFYKKGETKATYNHYDSYYEGLGQDIFNFIKEVKTRKLNKIFENIILVNEDNKPTELQKDLCKETTNLEVSNKSTDDWYCLLRETQGNFEYLKKGINNYLYMIDNQNFIQDSLFCEYAYIINLDNKTLEIYKGFNNKGQVAHRYRMSDEEFEKVKSSEWFSGYYECNFVKAIPLNEIINSNKKAKITDFI